MGARPRLVCSRTPVALTTATTRRRPPASRSRLAPAAGVVVVGVPGVALAVPVAPFLLFPPPVPLPEPRAATSAATSHFCAADGSLLASLHAQYNRAPIALDQMATPLRPAAVAS